MGWIQVKFSVILSNVTLPNIFLIRCDFDKFIVGLYYLCIFSLATKFKDGQRSVAITSINYLNSNFCSLT